MKKSKFKAYNFLVILILMTMFISMWTTCLCKRPCTIHNFEYNYEMVIIILPLLHIHVLLEKKQIIDAIFKMFFYYFILFFHRKLNIYKRLCVIVKRFTKTLNMDKYICSSLSGSLVPLWERVTFVRRFRHNLTYYTFTSFEKNFISSN